MTEMTLVDAAPRRTAVVHGNVPRSDLPAFLRWAFTSVAEVVERQGAHVAGPPVTIYRRQAGDRIELEAGFPVAAAVEADGAVVPSSLPGCRTVEALHHGPYATLPRTYAEIMAWIRDHGLRPAPVMWEVYLSDPAAGIPETLVVQPLDEPAA